MAGFVEILRERSGHNARRWDEDRSKNGRSPLSGWVAASVTGPHSLSPPFPVSLFSLSLSFSTILSLSI
eukprot:6214094-Pleurochrysis_carterae.AAC.3